MSSLYRSYRAATRRPNGEITNMDIALRAGACAAPLIIYAFYGIINAMTTPSVKIEKIIEQTDTSIVVEVDEYGDYYEGTFGMGSIFYTCYEIEDKKKNKLVDFYQGSSRPLIGDEITIETDENDKYICFKEGTGNYKLVAQKNTKTNKWRIANFLDKCFFTLTHPFLN